MTVASSTKMIPPTRDAIDSSFLPAMSHAELERIVTEVQDILAYGAKAARDGVLGGVLARDRRVREAFFRSFEIGYGVEPMVIKEIASRPWSGAIPDAWVRDGVFDDDTNFVPERFYLAVYRKNFTDPDWGRKAIAQARRMLAAGRVDPAYLTALVNVNFHESATIEQELRVYLPEGVSALTSVLAMTSGIAVSRMPEKMRADIDKIHAKIEWVQRERERVFRQVWLPAVLPAGEAAVVQQLPTGFLTDLYATQWEQGYAAYREAVIARQGERLAA